jgi:hypothetical protein
MIVRVACLSLLAAGCADATNSAKKAATQAASVAKEAAAKAGTAAKEAAESAAKAAKTAAEVTKEKLGEWKEAFKKEAEEKLGGYDKKLDEWKAKAKDASGDAKVKLEEQIKNGSAALATAKEHLAKLGDATADGWEAFKAKAAEITEQLKKAFE